MSRKLIFCSALALAGCRTAVPEPVVNTVEVVVPGPPSPCVPKEYQETRDYLDSDAALTGAVDAAERYSLLWAGREQRIAREQEMAAIIAGCPKEE